MDRRILVCLFAICVAALAARTARAAETCGDGLDNDSDSLTDEGCYPTGVTGVCESPIDCSRAGAVAPISGQLIYTAEPDLAPTVAFGPDLWFQRTYMSQYDPGYAGLGSGAVTDYKAPMGYRWHHNYMSWLEKNTAPNPDEIVVHMVNGQDVLFTFDHNAGGYKYYVPQGGHHVSYLRQKNSTGITELRTLTGTVYEYDWNDPTGKLTKIVDHVVGNEVTLSYNADGQVEWVTAASTRKKFKLEYQGSGSELLQYVKYYTNDGSTDTLQLTIEYTYGSGHLDLVKLDGVTVLDHAYETEYLRVIYDGETNAKQLAAFRYENTGGGEDGTVVLIETPEGDLGYEYDTECAGVGTESVSVTFHRASTAACDTDADCGTGEFCGGETNPGGTDTGTCFNAKRCLTVNTSGNEDLIDAVSASSCPSCVDTKDYTWDTTNLDVDGRQSADSVWTSYLYNSDGLITKMVEGDTDANASTVPAGARVTFYFYSNTDFPGRVTEVRRLSQLKPSGDCDDSTTTDCKRTIYAYTSGGQLDTVQELGFTKNGAGTTVSYNFTTDYDYDSEGRKTQILGPRPSTEDDLEFTYYTSGALDTGHLKEIKRQKDATTYLTTTYAEYDFFGNVGRVTDSNGKSICLTYHGDYNRLASRRQVINGSHTDCDQTAGSSDETTSYSYDTHKRITRVKKPRENCIDSSYDDEGRLETVSVFDNDSGSCATSGHSIVYTYQLDGQVTKIEWKNSAGAVTKRQQYTFYSDRRLENAINPVNTNYARTWSYDNDGVPTTLEFEDFSQSGAKTVWIVDDLNRTTEVRRHHSASDHEDFTLTQAAEMLGLPTEVVDEDSHDIDMEWDDLGRKVTQITEEAGRTQMVYDAAGNMTEKVEAVGAADEQTTTYTFDALNRVTAVDTGDDACFAQGGAEIQYSYDALPSGVSCPTGSDCSLLSGRLAYAKTVLWCDDAKADDTFDMEKFNSYDEAGRLIEHTVQNDAGSSTASRVQYSYDKNSNVTKLIPPSGTSAQAVYTHGSSDHDADDDRITLIERDTTDILGDSLVEITWLPFGPVVHYRQNNFFRHCSTFCFNYNVGVTFSYNLAYRLTDIVAQSGYSTPDPVLTVDHAEDVRGRYTQRNLSDGTAAQRDMFFLYDDLSRVTCRRTDSGSTCPSSGTSLGENISYNTSGDRSSVILRNGVYTDTTFTPSYQTDSDTLDRYSYGGGNNRVQFSHDTLGRRTADDDTNFGGTPDKDARTYTYDGRNNLVTVSGEYWTGNAWHTYTVTYAYDENNRLYFHSFVDADQTCGNDPCEAQTFYFWDQFDRLIQTKHTPDISDSDTYSVFQWYWLDRIPFLYYQIDFPNATTTRRYLHYDEQGRPLTAWVWPNTNSNTTRAWEVDPGLFGWDEVTVGANVYQPIRYPGQLYDENTEAWADDSGATLKRPGIVYNRYRSYDSFTGSYLQSDPMVDNTWDAYGYVAHNPVMASNPRGVDSATNTASEMFEGASYEVCPAESLISMPSANPADESNGSGVVYLVTSPFPSLYDLGFWQFPGRRTPEQKCIDDCNTNFNNCTLDCLDEATEIGMDLCWSKCDSIHKFCVLGCKATRNVAPAVFDSLQEGKTRCP